MRERHIGRRGRSRAVTCALAAASAVAAALALAFAAPADAATVGAEHQDGGSPRSDPLVYRAAPGEANALVVTIAATAVRFEDPGAVIAAGRDCTSVSAHEATCTRRHVPAIVLGDGDDSARVGAPGLSSSVAVVAYGGAGADSIEFGEAVGGGKLFGGPGGDNLSVTASLRSELDGEAGDDVLQGGGGPDVLAGGGGVDRLVGGAGEDRLADDDRETQDGTATPVDADTLDGGAGRDVVSYASRTAPLSIDLAQEAGNGEQGEGDSIRGVEDAVGGGGDDSIAGRDGRSELKGGRGNDTITGRGGADELDGEGGADVVDGGDGGDDVGGGSGDDTVRGGAGGDFVNDLTGRDSLDGGPGDDEVLSVEDNRAHPEETVRCGSGRDDVETDAEDLVAGDCERVVGQRLALASHGVLRGGRVVFPFRCARNARRGRCAVALELRADGKLVGAGSVRAPTRRDTRLTVRLRRSAQARIEREGSLRVQVAAGRATARGRIAGEAQLEWTILLERRG